MPNYERLEDRRTGMPDHQFAANLIRIYRHFGGKGEPPAGLVARATSRRSL